LTASELVAIVFTFLDTGIMGRIIANFKRQISSVAISVAASVSYFKKIEKSTNEFIRKALKPYLPVDILSVVV